MTPQHARIKQLISQGKSMGEIVEILKKENNPVEELFGTLFKKPKK